MMTNDDDDDEKYVVTSFSTRFLWSTF